MNDIIEKLHRLERFGSILGLPRMEELMKRLGNPEKELRFLHVAGTNGKGSVCKYLYEILRANGYPAGLYISPFLEVFHERIQFDGVNISEEDLAEAAGEVLRRVDEMVAEGCESPTEFEAVTAIAFVYFKHKKADPVVLEVGLGGSGDSTNIIEKALVSVIASVSFDHMDRLGDTLIAIAGEKAGIIKEGVPVVANVKDGEAAKVIARAAYEKNSVLHDVRKIKYCVTQRELSGYIFDAEICDTMYHDMQISMPGDHQTENALTALTVLEVLRKNGMISFEREKLAEGLRQAKQIGRFEILKENPWVIIDGAHNQQGAEALAETVRRHFAGKRILLCCGMLADKDVSGILSVFRKITEDFIATEPDSPRKLSAEELAAQIRSTGGRCEAAADFRDAFRMAVEKMDSYDVILFAGSLYLIGKIRRRWRDEHC